ncbi:MAG: Oxidoreductase, aldo/keto reductase family [Labilithrix sp.]|nr:Oxidoreductase, aldo/keto reductase family [Labilithrix sp.]
MRYKLFGRHTGLRVSELVLGAGNFGTKWGYGASPDEARRIFDRYVDAGGNFLDVANNYQFGEAETLLGEFMGAKRDELVVSSKFTLGTTPDAPITKMGNNRRNMVRSRSRRPRSLGQDRLRGTVGLSGVARRSRGDDRGASQRGAHRWASARIQPRRAHAGA